MTASGQPSWESGHLGAAAFRRQEPHVCRWSRLQHFLKQTAQLSRLLSSARAAPWTYARRQRSSGPRHPGRHGRRADERLAINKRLTTGRPYSVHGSDRAVLTCSTLKDAPAIGKCGLRQHNADACSMSGQTAAPFVVRPHRPFCGDQDSSFSFTHFWIAAVTSLQSEVEVAP